MSPFDKEHHNVDGPFKSFLNQLEYTTESVRTLPHKLSTDTSSFRNAFARNDKQYRVTKVLGDTYFVDFKMRFAPKGQTGGDFIY